jgi:transposase
MTRPNLRLESYLSTEELKTHYRSCKNAKEARRWHVLWLVSQGYSASQAAESVGLGVSWVREVINRYNREGPNSIKDQHRINPGGKKPRLDAKQQTELLEALSSPPADGGVWTGSKVAAWIKEKTGIETYTQLGWVYLQTLGAKVKLKKRSKTRGALSRVAQALHKEE